jgi:hypothetical protein
MSIQKIYNVAGFIDDKMLEKIKLKAMKEELKKWITIDLKRRYTFGVLDSIRSKLYNQ